MCVAMKMKISCCDYTFPLLPHNSVLDLIAMLGVEGVDIGLFGGRSHIRPEHVLEDIPGSARELSAQVSDRGLEIATVFLIPKHLEHLSFAANNPDAEHRRKSRDLFQRILEFVVLCNSAHMTGGAGVRWDGESLDASFQRDAEELAWRVEQAKEVGVTYAIEPHADSLAATPRETLRLIEMTPGLTLALDYSHFSRVGIPDSEIEPLIEFTSHLHVRGACENRLQASFKDNTIDYARILSQMTSTGYQGYVSLEYCWTEWAQCNEVDNLSETILFRDFLRGLKL